ncbi:MULTISPECIES: nuclear transport factor 2 family protein [unclassified Rhodococcus (in: high G+C Gram-positive bacteria)]|uniref:nuclear transport factor 2 family protein n=1 Tax=unclassified Rhodococcus (in: high G+C Gram-positive bacteria) TaxID=192944 RepID=UPI00146BF914|nr:MULTISPECIES: nuclear transport factor 2 family protein [unclassified Rhodococcus (in: high G+C Gram-positive bacteria)]MCK0090568.1 nuclear transport factor 2 family protein [Rhodococcus sp. F64268]NLU61763.1 nuclear transport factor 2 family protein [Rhodococcus sp. HNM0563]
MTDTAELVASLLERVQLLEDKAAIQEVLTAYGPAVDAGDADAVGELWAEDAVYDIDIRVMEGRDAITEMVRTRPHQDYINEGCGHLLDPVHIRVDGDTAAATCHSLLLRRNLDSDSYRVWRVTANRFDLARIDGKWKIKRRTARVLNGSEEARELLARASR